MRIPKEVKNLIENNAIALCTVSKGKPHVIAAGFCKVLNNKIIISCIYMKRTIANVKKNKNVAIAVWSKNWKKNCKGYELIGKAKYYNSGKFYKFVNSLKENKGLKPKGALAVTVNKIKELA